MRASMAIHKTDLGFKPVNQGQRDLVAFGLGGKSQALKGVQNAPLGVFHAADPATRLGVVPVAGAVVGRSDHVEVPPVEVGQTYSLPLTGACPKKGNRLHLHDDFAGPLRLQLARALQRQLADKRNKAKAIMTATGCSERTAKNWLAGATEPTATDMEALMKAFDAVALVVLVRAGLDPSLVRYRAIAAIVEEDAS